MSHSGRRQRKRSLQDDRRFTNRELCWCLRVLCVTAGRTLLGWAATYLTRALQARPLRAVTVNQLRERLPVCRSSFVLCLYLCLCLCTNEISARSSCCTREPFVRFSFRSDEHRSIIHTIYNGVRKFDFSIVSFQRQSRTNFRSCCLSERIVYEKILLKMQRFLFTIHLQLVFFSYILMFY